MPADSDYVIDFDSDAAYSIVYEDSEGRLTFVYEIGTSPKSIVLNGTPIIDKRRLPAQDDLTSPRLRRAFERTKEFLQGCGYTVERFGG